MPPKSRSSAKLKDAVYLVAVAVCAVVFVVAVLDHARAPGGAEGAAPKAVQGETRQVDEERLRRLLRRGHLSDREAMHYAPAAPVTKDSKAGP